jgi:putative ABC transport system substrate-binding protein
MMLKSAFQRCQLAALFIAALALCFSLTSASAEDAEMVTPWFRHGVINDRNWNFVTDAAVPMRVSIRRKVATDGRAKRVLVLYPRASSAYDTAITEMLRTFSAKEINVEFDIFNFELNTALGTAALRAAEKSHVDLVFAMGSESAAWLYNNYKGGALPVVTVCSKDPVQLGQIKSYDSGSGNNFAFTSLNVPINVQMAYVHALRPHLQNIAVLVDSKNVSAVETQAAPIAKYAKEIGVHVVWSAVKDPTKAREELSQLVPDAVREMRRIDPDLDNSLFWLTGSTSVFREIQTINKFADHVPVVSVVPELVTEGPDTAVLAIGVSFESNAKLAAIYGAKILSGTPPGELNVGVISPPDLAVSFLKAREIGMKVPFNFLEIASFVYDYQGKLARTDEQP